MGSFNKVIAERDIIFFDGVCNLCNRSVQFILKRDRSRNFLFASLQSDFAKEKLQALGVHHSFDTIVLMRGEKCFLRSNAVLEIARKLHLPWSLLYVFKIVPASIRDALYNRIANSRYSVFGKRNTCMIPSPEWKDRFIE